MCAFQKVNEQDKRCKSVAVLDALKPVRRSPTTIPIMPIHPLNGTHTQSMSQLSQGLEILIQPVSSPSSTLMEVDLTLTRDHRFHLYSPVQSIIERAGVHNVLYTQCTLKHFCVKSHLERLVKANHTSQLLMYYSGV